MNSTAPKRPSRLRRTAALRQLTADTVLPPAGNMVWPVFLVDGSSRREPIVSMPGQARLGIDELCRDVEPLLSQGVRSLLLFGVPNARLKDEIGSAAAARDSLVCKAVRALRDRFPGLAIFTDVCLCAYTSHGHCGALEPDGAVDNDRTLPLLADIAVAHADSGADGVAPSAMMDGQVSAIRAALDGHGLSNTVIMSYSTKFASAFYGPFRDAASSAPAHGDRSSHQASPSALRQAIRESTLDAEEGADILMVKPALLYLDVIARLREQVELPLAAYNVSGEYSMIHAMAERGWGDLDRMAAESLLAIRRAGADIVISYWANRYAAIAKEGETV